MRKYILVCICFFSSLFGDWNEKFDKQSLILSEQIEEFQGKYQEIYGSFVKMRKGILKDFLFQKQIGTISPEQRIILLRPKEGVVVKKRSNDNITELFSWELSYLLGGGDFMIPSFPIEIVGKKVIVQKMEPFAFKEDKVMKGLPKGAKKVTVDEYWRAHLQAYLLGLDDLVGHNIGINSLNHIRFFDAESSLSYQNGVIRTCLSFKPGFLSQSLEWPQYRQPLDKKSLLSIRRFVDSFSSVEDKLELYLSLRAAPVQMELLLFRLEKVRTFSFVEGCTFLDFYAHVFPKMSEGLDELSHIASDILQRKVDHGSALILVSRWIDRHELSSSQKRSIENWIERYVD